MSAVKAINACPCPLAMHHSVVTPLMNKDSPEMRLDGRAGLVSERVLLVGQIRSGNLRK
jgi:hypothetical protein